jgi:hypothetical protein
VVFAVACGATARDGGANAVVALVGTVFKVGDGCIGWFVFEVDNDCSEQDDEWLDYAGWDGHGLVLVTRDGGW